MRIFAIAILVEPNVNPTPSFVGVGRFYLRNCLSEQLFTIETLIFLEEKKPLDSLFHLKFADTICNMLLFF